MRLIKRPRKLEDDYAIVDRPVVRIYPKDKLVRLGDGRKISIDEYKRMVAFGEIGEFRKEVLVKRLIITIPSS